MPWPYDNPWESILDLMVVVEMDDVVNPELYGFVKSVADLLKERDAQLQSRQVIALAIATWSSLNPDKSLTVKEADIN